MTHRRLPWLRPEDLNEEQKVLHDAIVNSPRSSSPGRSPLFDDEGRLHGPFNALLFNPKVGNSMQDLGTSVRYGTSLSGRAREIAVLEVARARESNYEWLTHAQAGRAAGLSEDELSALSSGSPIETLAPDEHEVRAVVQSLIDTHDIPDDLYRSAVDHLGVTTVVELVVLVGYYELVALVLRVSRTPLPDGYESEFPLG